MGARSVASMPATTNRNVDRRLHVAQAAAIVDRERVAGLATFAVGSVLAALSGPTWAHARSVPANESAPAGADQPEPASADQSEPAAA
jgi:hypothetical protein